MDGFLIFIIFCIVIILAVFITCYRHYDKRKALTLPKEAPCHTDDSLKSAKAIGTFLHERAELAGISFEPERSEYTSKEFFILKSIYKKETNAIYNGKAAGVVVLCRMAHQLGCNVIVREITESGLDDMRTEEELQKRKSSRERTIEINNKLKELGL